MTGGRCDYPWLKGRLLHMLRGTPFVHAVLPVPYSGSEWLRFSPVKATPEGSRRSETAALFDGAGRTQRWGVAEWQKWLWSCRLVIPSPPPPHPLGRNWRGQSRGPSGADPETGESTARPKRREGGFLTGTYPFVLPHEPPKLTNSSLAVSSPPPP